MAYLLTFLAALAPGALANTLQQILLTDSVEAAQQLSPAPGGGLVVVASTLPKFDAAELSKRLAVAKDRPIDDRLLAAIAQVVEVYARQNDFLAAAAVIPPQSIAGGVVRVAILLGKVRNIRVEGNNWFSESLLREKLKIERGAIVRGSELAPAVNWTNNNPFRRIRVHLEPVSDTGEVDVIVGVKDRAPIRLSASYDNTGNDLLGENRYTAALTYGNVWGRDHMASYQFITTDDINLFRGHGIDYRAPLPSRHVVSFTGSYVTVNPAFLEVFTQNAKSITTSLKYAIPMTRGKWQGEVSSSLDFKQTNNNLEYGGVPVLGDTTDIFTATLSAAAYRDDQRGRWIANVSLTGSPGSVNSNSSKFIYNDSRLGANPLFAYGQLGLQRLTRLTPTLTSTLRGAYQIASTNLLSNEQFSLGGFSSVRGYKERVIAGDGGYLASHEIQQKVPSIKLGKRVPELDAAVVGFFDYGRIYVKHPIRNQRKTDYLSSVGVGLRLSMASNFSATLDYARQLERVEVVGESHHRFHVRVALSY